MAKLNSICKIYSGTGFPTEYQGKNRGDYPFYKVGDISRNAEKGYVFLKECGNFIDEETCHIIKGTVIPPGTVVFAKIGEAVKLNRRAITSCPCLIDNNVMGISPDEQKITLNYFYHFMCSLKLEVYAQATTVPSVKKSTIENIEIPLPSLEVQQQIAEKLDHITNLIDLCDTILEKLDLLIKSQFVEMFGDPIINTKGWKKLRLDAISENLDHCRVPIASSERKSGNYPYYGASGIVDYVEGYIFDEDLLLISEDGANLLMRSTPIAFSVKGKIWVNNHAHVVRFASKAVQKYIEVYFSLMDISENVTGTAQPKLNQAKLNAMLFCIPPIELQEQFADFVNQIDRSKSKIKQIHTQAQTMKNALMQKYFPVP